MMPGPERRWHHVLRVTAPTGLFAVVLVIGGLWIVREAKAASLRHLMKTIEVAGGGGCFDDLSVAASKVRQWGLQHVAAQRVLSELRPDNPYFVKAIYVVGELECWNPDIDYVLSHIQSSAEYTEGQRADAEAIAKDLRQGGTTSSQVVH